MHRRPQAAVGQAMFDTWREVGLAGAIAQWSLAWLPLPATPHIEVYHFGSPATIATELKSPYFKLAPEDIAVLENDPGTRQRYTELVVETRRHGCRLCELWWSCSRRRCAGLHAMFRRAGAMLLFACSKDRARA